MIWRGSSGWELVRCGGGNMIIAPPTHFFHRKLPTPQIDQLCRGHLGCSNHFSLLLVHLLIHLILPNQPPSPSPPHLHTRPPPRLPPFSWAEGTWDAAFTFHLSSTNNFLPKGLVGWVPHPVVTSSGSSSRGSSPKIGVVAPGLWWVELLALPIPHIVTAVSAIMTDFSSRYSALLLLHYG